MLIISVILIFSLFPLHSYSSREYTVILPFVFDQRIIDISGDLVLTEDENGIYVYTAEGVPVKLEPYDMASLENGYIKIRPKESRQWTVCRKDGSRIFKECYDGRNSYRSREQAILTILRIYRAYLMNQPGNSH